MRLSVQADCSVVEIDRTLSREHFHTSRGTPWPRHNDGRVVVRTLLRHGAHRLRAPGAPAVPSTSLNPSDPWVSDVRQPPRPPAPQASPSRQPLPRRLDVGARCALTRSHMRWSTTRPACVPSRYRASSWRQPNRALCR
eukprot:scaffold2549_cov108-Isochrysis_galbana.AAC.7